MTDDDFPSRYTDHPAIALISLPDGASRYPTADADTGSPSEAAHIALGDDDTFDALGEPAYRDGSFGRGASAWVPVIEWIGLTVGQGIIGAAAWEGVRRAAAELRDAIDRLRSRRVQLAVSRGAAALLAMQHVLDSGAEHDVLDVESVAEPETIAGREHTEPSYLAHEPWLVSLLNAPRTVRYVVAVQPDGQIAGTIAVPINDAGRYYGALPPRDG